MPAVVITLLLAGGASLDDDELARRAEEGFARGLARREQGENSRGLFREAARDFEELRRRGARNALLERNLGNACLLAGDLPRAILAYRRGLRLAPGDRTLQRNLALARRRVVFLEGSALGRPPEGLRPAWLPSAPRALFALAVLAHACLCACLTRWYMVRRGPWLVAALAALVVALGTTLMLIGSFWLEPARRVVVIASNGVLLRKGNGKSFPPRFDTALNAGVEASLLYRQEGWLQIELSGGEVGWVPASEVVVEEEEGDRP